LLETPSVVAAIDPIDRCLVSVPRRAFMNDT